MKNKIPFSNKNSVLTFQNCAVIIISNIKQGEVVMKEKTVVVEFDKTNNLFIFCEYVNKEKTKHEDYFASEIDYDAQLLNKFHDFLGIKNAPLSQKLGFSQNIVEHLRDRNAIEYALNKQNIVMLTDDPYNFIEEFKVQYESDNLSKIAEDSFVTFNEHLNIVQNSFYYNK